MHYVFRGAWDGDPIPGVRISHDKTFAPMDAVNLLSGLGDPEFCASNQRAFQYTPIFSLNVSSVSLYNYQSEGANWLYHRDYAILADQMGLGKTVQAITAAEARLTNSHGEGSGVLILCPALAKLHWACEVKRWTGHDAIVLDGLAADEMPNARYIIANYDILFGQRRRDAAGKLNEVVHLGGWHKQLAAAKIPIVICDEAHILRGQNSRRTAAVKAVARDSTVVWLLTGTPMPNHVRDLWSLWDLCSGGLAGKFWPWAKAYCGAYKGQYGWVADGCSRLGELNARVRTFMLGRSKDEVGLQLPEKRRELITVDVGSVVSVGGILNGKKTTAVAHALRQTAYNKRKAIVEMANEALAAGQKVIVFVWLREQAHEIHDAIDAGAYIRFVATGDQSPEQRNVLARNFRECTEPAVFVATIDSVGVAISLVGADLVIFGDLSWEPAKLLQAEGRAHRHGSVNRVLVRYVIAKGTFDEAVAETVVDKLATIEEAVGTTADAAQLAGGLSVGRVTTTEAIIDRLYEKLVGGST
jgi:SNF2 family DNA or RNA helicase